MFEISSNLAQVAAAASALITIFGLFALIVRGFHWFRKLPEEIRNYLFKPRLVLLPTADEVAKYSVKAFDPVRPNAEELNEEWRGVVSYYRKIRYKVAGLRIKLIAFFCAAVYYIFLARMIFWKSTHDAVEYERFWVFWLSLLGLLLFMLGMTWSSTFLREGVLLVLGRSVELGKDSGQNTGTDQETETRR